MQVQQSSTRLLTKRKRILQNLFRTLESESSSDGIYAQRQQTIVLCLARAALTHEYVYYVHQRLLIQKKIGTT